MKLVSQDIRENVKIGENFIASSDFGFGTSGQNVRPSFQWSDIPEGTKELAFTVFDPDAPTGCGFWHWLLVHIDPKATQLSDDVVAAACQVQNDFGVYHYGGPCPPKGSDDHRYYFTLYALNESLSAQPDTPAAQIGFQLNFKTIQKVHIMGVYSY